MCVAVWTSIRRPVLTEYGLLAHVVAYLTSAPQERCLLKEAVGEGGVELICATTLLSLTSTMGMQQ